MNVMLIDDNKTVLDAMNQLIPWEENGYQIAGSFKNGLEALQFIRKNKDISIIFTDMKMPVMDGLSFIREIHALKLEPAIFVLSSFDEFSLVRTAFTLGITDYLLKSELEPEHILKLCNEFRLLKLDTGVTENRIVKMVFDIVETEYREDLTLKLIADRLKISNGYLGQLFSKFTGESFADCLNKKRIREAMKMLSGQNLKIYEVAFACGYNNVEHFSRIFKKITGKAPKQWV